MRKTNAAVAAGGRAKSARQTDRIAEDATVLARIKAAGFHPELHISRREAAAFLGISEKSVDRLDIRRIRSTPHRVCFRLGDIMQMGTGA